MKKTYKSTDEIAEFFHQPRFLKLTEAFWEWGGADVIVTSLPLGDQTSKTVVTTRHAKALTWLFRQLKDRTILSEIIWKYELYGNLALAALRYQYSCMSAEQKAQLSELQRQSLEQFFNTSTSTFRPTIITSSYGCQVDCSAGDEENPQGLLVAVLAEAERMLSEYYVKLFVYGTLMRGESNHLWIEDAEEEGRDAVENEQLFDLGSYPMLLTGEGTVSGEVYSIPLKTLQVLDRLEGHPDYFQRQWFTLKSGSQALAYQGREEIARNYPVIKSGDWRSR